MNIEEKDITDIENALGVKFYEHQIKYLLDDGELEETGLPKEMQADSGPGKTFAYCIKLAFSEGKVLNLNKPEQFADNRALQGEDYKIYAKKMFRAKFISVWCKLHDYHRFTLRDIFI